MPGPTPFAATTPLPPTLGPTPTPPRPTDVATAYVTAWQDGRYSAMYDLLTPAAQASTTRDLFVRRYSNIHAGIGEVWSRSGSWTSRPIR